MENIKTMLRSHPHAEDAVATPRAEALQALSECAQTCTSCADACLGEDKHLTELRRCIRTDLDCADICVATMRIVSRLTESPYELVHQQLHACITACQICAEECEQHASAHEHCRMCAEACRRCQEKCNILIGELSDSGVVSPENTRPLSS